MDLIIEFIVWICQALSGEKENKSSTGTAGGAKPPAARGPYNYGDGRPVVPGKQRTLEEILEDVKREQSAGKASSPRVKAQRVEKAPVFVEKVKTPSLSRPLSEVQQPTELRGAAPAPLPSMGGAIQSKIEGRVLAPTIDEREVVRPVLERKFEKLAERETQQSLGIGHTKMVAEVNTVTTMGEVQTVDTMGASLSNKKSNAYADFFKAMRNAKPKTRAEMARQAFVYAEVFGPPRCKNPHRR